MGFESALRQYFAGVILLPIAAAAYFQALGISSLIASALAPETRSTAEPAHLSGSNPRLSGPSPADHARSARAILDRNPFDSTAQRPLDAVPSPADAGAAPPVDLEHYANAPPCEGVKALIIVA